MEFDLKWDALRESEAGRSLVADALGAQLKFQQWRKDVLAHALTMCAVLGDVVGRACAPERYVDSTDRPEMERRE